MTLAIDGTPAHVTANPASSLPVTITTSQGNDIICVIIETNGGPVTGVTSPNLTFTKRMTTSGGSQPEEFWYAVASKPLAAETITAQTTSSAFIAIDAFAISGANTSIIFDSNGSLPAFGTSSPLTVSTTNPRTIIIQACRSSVNTAPAIDSGFTAISQADFQAVAYRIVSAPQTGLTITMDGASANGIVADAIMELFGPNVTTTLTNVPAKAFTKKHYEGLISEIREEGAAKANLSEVERMELEYSEAQEAANKADEQLFGQYNYTSYGKSQDAKDRLKELQEKRNRHYYMEVVKKAWADHEAKKK